MTALRSALLLCLFMVVGVPTGQATDCPPGVTTSAPANGVKVKIVSVHPDDAYFSSASDLIGTTGTGTDLTVMEGCWMAGSFAADDGESYYFYKAAMVVTGGAAAPVADASCPAGASTVSDFAEGQRLKLVGIHAEDAYYSDSATLIGTKGVVSGDLHNNGGCWFGGSFTADSGDSYYFYKGAFVALDGAAAAPTPAVACPAGSASSGIAGGSRVRILGLHPDDAFYGDRGSLVGLSGKVDGDLHPTEGCWLAGGFVSDAGQDYYFYKAAVANIGGSSGSADKQYKGGSVSSGTTFRVLDIHADDAFYGDRSSIIGKTCTATDELSKMAKGWFAGPAVCTDGSDYYFYKVGVALLK